MDHIHETATDSWQPAIGVTSCTHGDVTIILSLDTGRYATVDELGGRIWTGICAAESIAHIAHQIAREYAVADVESVRRDVTAFVESLKQRKFVCRRPDAPFARKVQERRPPGQPGLLPSPLRPPSVFACLVILACVHTLLRAVGLRWIMTRLLQLGTERPAAALPRPWLDEFVHNVRAAAAIYPLRSACLVQSLSLLWGIRRAGGDARLRIGVAPFPFRAHAWVEHLGSPVNEDEETLAVYRVMPDVDFCALRS